MNYNFVKEFKKHLVSVKVNHYGKHIILNVPFYGGFLSLSADIKDGFLMDVKCTANVLNEVRRIKSLDIKFSTADTVSRKMAEVLNELTLETQNLSLGILKVKSTLEV